MTAQGQLWQLGMALAYGAFCGMMFDVFEQTAQNIRGTVAQTAADVLSGALFCGVLFWLVVGLYQTELRGFQVVGLTGGVLAWRALCMQHFRRALRRVFHFLALIVAIPLHALQKMGNRCKMAGIRRRNSRKTRKEKKKSTKKHFPFAVRWYKIKRYHRYDRKTPKEGEKAHGQTKKNQNASAC